MIHFESGIDTAVQAYADRKDSHCQPGIASRVRSDYQSDRWSQLADAVDDLSRGPVIELSARDHPVGYVRHQHREYPHGQVGKRGNGAVL